MSMGQLKTALKDFRATFIDNNSIKILKRKFSDTLLNDLRSKRQVNILIALHLENNKMGISSQTPKGHSESSPQRKLIAANDPILRKLKVKKKKKEN